MEELLQSLQVGHFFTQTFKNKVGRVFPMVFASILPHAEVGQNDHREDAPLFSH